MKFILNIVLLLLFSSALLSAQTDKIKINKTSAGDSVFIMQKSPTGAMLRSAALPGWGQFYNESYWKIPVIWGTIGWFSYMWIDRNNGYEKYRDLYLESLTNTPAGDIRFKNIRNSYRDDRDKFAVYLGLTYFLNLVDAYVDAHLFDFDVGINNITHKPELLIRIKL